MPRFLRDVIDRLHRSHPDWGADQIARAVRCSPITVRKYASCPRQSRCHTHPSLYRYVRRVQGRKFQARIFLGGGRRHGFSINLGLFDSEWSAGQAVKRAVKALPVGTLDPLAIWQAWKAAGLIGDVLPSKLLPAGVRRGKDGRYYTREMGNRVGDGPFDTVESAYHAWRAARQERRRHAPAGQCVPQIGPVA